MGKVLKKLKIWGPFVLLALISIGEVLCFSILFSRQAMTTDGLYYSDLPAHIEFARNGTGYSLVDVLLSVFIKFSDGIKAVGVFGALLCVASLWGTYFLLNRKIDIEKWRASLISIALIFWDSLYIPYFSPYFDLTGFVMQPWHSFTYLGMKAFAILTVYFQYDYFPLGLKKINFKQWLLIALCLFFATWIKPNFLIAYSLTLLLFLIFNFLKSKANAESFKDCVAMGCTVFPSVFIALFQSLVLFGGENADTSSVRLCSLSESILFKNGNGAACLQIVCCLFLPALILVTTWKKKTKQDIFVLIMFCVSFFEIVFLVEEGTRSKDRNFYWSIFISSYFLLVFALSKVSKVCFKNKWLTVLVKILILIICVWHIASGILRFFIIWQGMEYNSWPWIIEPYFGWMYHFLY